MVTRLTKFCRSKFSEAVPEGGDYGDAETALIAELTEKVKTYEAHMGAIEVRKAAAALRAIWVAGNEYLQAQAPWTTIKEDPAKAEMQVRLGLNLIRLYGILSAPFIPTMSRTMLDAMGASDADWPSDVAAALTALQPGHGFTVPENLFTKITDDQRADWASRFAGVRD